METYLHFNFVGMRRGDCKQHYLLYETLQHSVQCSQEKYQGFGHVTKPAVAAPAAAGVSPHFVPQNRMGSADVASPSVWRARHQTVTRTTVPDPLASVHYLPLHSRPQRLTKYPFTSHE